MTLHPDESPKPESETFCTYNFIPKPGAGYSIGCGITADKCTYTSENCSECPEHPQHSRKESQLAEKTQLPPSIKDSKIAASFYSNPPSPQLTKKTQPQQDDRPDCDQFGGRLGGTATLYFEH